MPGKFSPVRRQQRGISLFGLLFWAIAIAFIGLMTARVFPSVLEYYTIKKMIAEIVVDNPATVPAVRAEFDRAKTTQYSIDSIGSQDLIVTKDNDKLVISFSYVKEIPVAGPVFLEIKYAGSTD